MNWEVAFARAFGFSESSPHWMMATLFLFVLFLMVLVPAITFISYLERKIGADIQARIGPNQAGPAGILQPLADVLKLLQKVNTHKTSSIGQDFWLVVLSMVLYSTVAFLPLGSSILLLDTDMSIFLPFWVALVLAFGAMLIGFMQKTVSGGLSGVRVVAQAISGTFPALIVVLTVGYHAGGFRWSTVVMAQGASPWEWNLVASPFLFIEFFVFVLSGLVLLNIPPLDAGWSFQDLRGGIVSQFSGRRLSLFRFSRIYLLFLWSVVSVVLFAGAWRLPKFLDTVLSRPENFWFYLFFQMTVVLSKSLVIIFFVIWFARVNPRIRTDQVTDLTWKVLGPVALISFVGTVIWKNGGLLF